MMNKKGSTKKRYVVVVGETLHYRLRETAIRKRLKLAELVDLFLWDALKLDLRK